MAIAKNFDDDIYYEEGVSKQFGDNSERTTKTVSRGTGSTWRSIKTENSVRRNTVPLTFLFLITLTR